MKTLYRRKLVAAWLSTICALASTTAHADDRSTAANFFDAGAQAYDAGHYLVAAEAFLKAHALIKSPALQFSAAQAYRRQYLVDSSPDALRRAVRLYRDYLRDDPSGKRREEAVSALADLVPLAARLRKPKAALVEIPAATPPVNQAKPTAGKPGTIPIPVPVPSTTATPPPPTAPAPDPMLDEVEEAEPEAPRKTRLLVSIKPESAEISIDDGPFVRVPAIVEVKPGAHRIRTKAAGYFDEEFQMDAVENELIPRHVTLRPKPGRLVVESTTGAGLMLDGQLRAILPQDRALEVEPGEHFISITRAGRVSFGKTITIERDREAKIRADLAMTGQRTAAWSTFAVGLAGAAAGGVLAGLTWDRNDQATTLDAKRQGGMMTPGEVAAYNEALEQRNAFAFATAITTGASALVLLTSAGMFLFDNPDAVPVPSRQTESKPAAPRIDLTVGLSSAAVRVTF